VRTLTRLLEIARVLLEERVRRGPAALTYTDCRAMQAHGM
jgi:hypothetical protein